MKLVDNRTDYTLKGSSSGDKDVILTVLHRIAAVVIKSLKNEGRLAKLCAYIVVYFSVNF